MKNLNYKQISGISVVIPMYDEKKNLPLLYKDLQKFIYYWKKPYQIIFVDDGSKDNSFEIVKGIAEKNKNVIGIKLGTNYGQSTAINAGISFAKLDVVITIDADLQHNPKDIFRLLEKINQGYDLVCGWRKHRSKSNSVLGKVLPSLISNFLARVLFNINLHDITGGMRGFKRKIINSVIMFNGAHRYLPILVQLRGFKIAETPIRIRERRFGETKYGLKRIFNGFYILLLIKFVSLFKMRFHSCQKKYTIEKVTTKNSVIYGKDT